MPVHQSFLLNPTPFGDQEYTTAGTFSWIAPAGVFSVDAVCVGGGGGGGTTNADASSGGGGGGLGWKNNISVVPGSSYTVVVGSGGAVLAAGGQSSFVSAATVAGNGGSPGVNGTANGGAGGTFVGDGGGAGGQGGNSSTNDATNSTPEAGAGGGAGGYSGTGGRGAGAQAASTSGSAGTGGAGGGGGSPDSGAAGGGGGVGLQGEAQSGAGGSGTSAQGGGGSGGAGSATSNAGGAYGGGGAGSDGGATSGAGGGGAVRIVWGYNRTFPTTNAGNLFDTATRNPLDIHPWLSAAGLSACTIARDTAVTDSPAGGVPLRMSVTGADPHIATYAAATWNIAPAANGQTWRVSVLAKASTATTMQILVFGAASNGSWTNAAGNIGGSAIFNVSTAWQDYLYDFTFANATVAFFQFRLDGPEPSGAGQNLWFDNVRIARLS